LSDKKKDEELVSVARKRLAAAMSATSESRNNELDDLRFAAGSPDNQWQWPNDVLGSRGVTSQGESLGARPCLTINKLPQHIKQVTNDQRQNRPSGKVIPADSNADVEMAEIFNGMVRHIEYISDADVAYDTACENQVTFGEGYIRILTEYVDDAGFEQEILIRRVRNSFSVYMDPMIQDPCGADAKWCFITEDITKDEYEVQYPDAQPISTLLSLGTGDRNDTPWIGDETIRIAEYFYYETTPETLNLYPGGQTAFKGTPEDKALALEYGAPVRSRRSEKKQIKWCKTNGYEILESSDWPGKCIPVVRVIGNEFEVDGRLYVSGIVRNAKDAQRMYNYWASQEAEMLALAPKAPFIGYGGQFEGYENQWKTANTKNWPYLEVNPEVTDGNGGVLPLPQRAQPPMAQHGLIAAKQGASEDIKETTGQYNASLGMASNERSGKAILARQHEGDKSTYHYVDNLARAVRYVTRQLVDLIPKIYDTARIARVLGEDGESKMVKIDPEQPAAVTKQIDQTGIVIDRIYNPNVGKYDVMVVTGPGYATKRLEALESMATLLQGNPELWGVAGDLFVKNMDWPGAQELSKRLAKTIDPKLMGDENPEMQKAQQQMQEMQQQLQQSMGMIKNFDTSLEKRELDLKEMEVQIKLRDSEIKAYDAETKRIQVTAAAMTPEQVQDIVRGTIDAAVQTGDLSGGMPQAPQMPMPEPQQPPMEMPQPPMSEPPMQPPMGMPGPEEMR
jgi:hypothetical protein